MRVRSYVYDSRDPPPHVEKAIVLIDDRDEEPDLLDVAAGDDPKDARREAMLTVKNAVRIGSTPDELFGEDGRPDFSAGTLITEAETGRRSLHVGEAALEALEEE